MCVCVCTQLSSVQDISKSYPQILTTFEWVEFGTRPNRLVFGNDAIPEKFVCIAIANSLIPYSLTLWGGGLVMSKSTTRK